MKNLKKQITIASTSTLLLIAGLSGALTGIAAPAKAAKAKGYNVRGHHYEVMSTESAKHYDQKGIASWYDEDLVTANGEKFDTYAMTAASKELPIGTKVRVTNLENYKSVVVRINDRGPFVKGRIIDLSYAGAKALGFDNKGMAPVEVTTVA
jgi:rare lipoprotein A